MDQKDTNSGGQTRTLIIGGFVVVAVLILIGLFLPPISLGERLGFGGDEPAETSTEETAETDGNRAGTFVTGSGESAAMPEGVALALSRGSAQVTAMNQSDFLSANAAAQPPENLTITGDVYTVSSPDSNVQGQIALPVPTDAANLAALDLYGWDSSSWFFIPSSIDVQSKQVVSADQEFPQAFALMETTAPAEFAVTNYVNSGANTPTALLPLVSDIVISGLKLNSEGTLDGEIEPQPNGPYNQWVQVSNVGPVIDQVALSTLLGDAELQKTQIEQLVSLAEAGGYQGVELDYQQVPENQADAFSQFSRDLADALHAKDLRLAITLGTPNFTGSDWNSGGQDWAALGEIADVVHVELPLDPREYDQDDEATQLLAFATRQVDRNKLRTLNNAAAVTRFGETFSPLSNNEALSNFGELQFVQGSEEVNPNETVEVALSGSAKPLEWDGDSLTYRYSYEKDGQTHEVWLGSEAAFNHRIQQTKAFNLSGLGIHGLETIEDGTSFAAVLANFQGEGEELQSPGAAIAWTVRDENDSVVASESGNELAFSWDAGEKEGEYTINADFALGDNIANLGAVTVLVKDTAQEVADADSDSDAEAEEGEPVEETSSAETTTDEPTVTFSGDGDAVVNVGANLRTGPGLTYGTLADGVDPGVKLDLIGRNSDSSWLNVIVEDGREGWIFSSLVTVNPTVNVAQLEVIEVAAPALAAASSTDGDEGAGGDAAPAAAPPPPVAAAPVSNPGFELGGQSHGFGNPQLMSYAGMNWIKFQHKWGSGDDPSAVAGRIQQAHANGFKVLLSIPGQNTYPDSIDFNGYIEFLRGVAALGPDAIEVWNEENIDFEWPAGQIDPASYVNNMLAPAYNAIKGANPNVMVISGAPAPTGFFGGGCSANGCDDNAYLAGMAAAGAANYMDCVGAHFNAGATAPGQSTGHPAGSNHYSWYFQPTLDLYYSSLGKPVCFTELGYLSGEDFGGVPSRFSWAGNTSVSEHAQWLAEAVSLAANSGKTRLAIIFNVDFTMFGDDPQAGYAMIRPDGSCPSCETLRQVMGR
jgi:spore germination protein YaaH